MSEDTPGQTIKARIAEMMDNLTASERKLASVILADYPYAGLTTIQDFAERTHVSAPSITRFVSKIGCSGYQDFQRQLIGELKQRELSPIQLKFTESPPQGAHFLSDYTMRLVQQMNFLSDSIPPQQFDEVCALLADPSRSIFVIGGRVTDNIAMLLSMHLRQIRGRIHHLPQSPELWPDYVMRMRKQDVVIIFDVRRYQTNLETLARIISQERQSTIITMTDKWLSPVGGYSSHIFAAPIDPGTAWDTLVCLLTLVEAMIVRVSEGDWDGTRKRIENWDRIRFALAPKETNKDEAQ